MTAKQTSFRANPSWWHVFVASRGNAPLRCCDDDDFPICLDKTSCARAGPPGLTIALSRCLLIPAQLAHFKRRARKTLPTAVGS